MTDSIEDFFKQNVNESTGVPAYKFENLGDTVGGVIVAVRTGVVTEQNSTTPKLDKNGKEQPQIAVTIQTDLRNWEKANKVPTDADNNPKPASEDDGKRRVYVKYGSNVSLLGQAIKAAGGSYSDLREGAKFGAQLSELIPTPKGQLKQFKYFFEKGAAPAPQGLANTFAQAEASQPQGQVAPEPANPFSTTPAQATQETFAAAAPADDEPPF